jgi:hypothetical protein
VSESGLSKAWPTVDLHLTHSRITTYRELHQKYPKVGVLGHSFVKTVDEIKKSG